MTRLVLDSASLACFQNLTDLTEVCDPAGRTLGYFHPVKGNGEKGAARSPFSREELQALRQQKTGRLLADVLKDLGRS